MRRRLLTLAGAALLAAPLAGCAAPMHIGAHLEPGVSFRQYQTFDWAPADALPTGDPRLDNNPFFHDYFEGAVEKELAARGLERTEWGTPDLLIHYHTNVRQRFLVGSADTESPYCAGTDCNGRITEYEAGTFVLDMIDPFTNKLVWRGWAQTNVDGVIDNQDWLRDHLHVAVERMMKLFPVQPAAGRSDE
jgi:hypothetical protein